MAAQGRNPQGGSAARKRPWRKGLNQRKTKRREKIDNSGRKPVLGDTIP